METVLAVLKFLALNWEAILLAVIGILGSILVILKLIPGEQGESVIEKAKGLLERLLRKKPPQA